MQIYNVGLDALDDWETADYEWRSFSMLTFIRASSSVAAAINTAVEITATGYAALPVSGAARTINEAASRIEYHADNPEWISLSAGQTVNAILLTKVEGNDNGSTPVGMWAITPGVATDAADPLTFDLAGGMVAYIKQA